MNDSWNLYLYYVFDAEKELFHLYSYECFDMDKYELVFNHDINTDINLPQPNGIHSEYNNADLSFDKRFPEDREWQFKKEVLDEMKKYGFEKYMKYFVFSKGFQWIKGFEE